MNLNLENLNYETVCKDIPIQFPPQHQNVQPGMEYLMNPRPIFDDPNYMGTGKLTGKVAIITGGDSGIGRAVAVLFAKEGADIVIVYYNEHQDATLTKQYINGVGRQCLLIPGDLREESFSLKVVDDTVKNFGHIDILVNNAGVGYPANRLTDISSIQLIDTFSVNVFSYFYMTQACLPYFKKGATIVNTASSTAYRGFPNLIDYSATKGAVVSFTRALANSLVEQGIRVNAVAPGITWTPIIPSGLDAESVKIAGSDSPMQRAAQPIEIAYTYLYLVSNASTYVTGQVLHVDGGSTMSS